MQQGAPILQFLFGGKKMKPRGILPTQISDRQVILCKAAPMIRNAYEIRLALFMAVQSGREFVLAVSSTAKVDPALEAHIRQHGGEVVRAEIGDHSVYVGAIDRDGGEVDGWVAGDSHLWAAILAGLRSTWLRDRLIVGASIPAAELLNFREVLLTEVISASNIDEEDIQQALIRLCAEAIKSGGLLFVQ